VRARSLDQRGNPTYTDQTDSNGFYRIDLPARTDHYHVTLINLPSGFTIVFPSDGDHDSVFIKTNSSQDHATGEHRDHHHVDHDHHDARPLPRLRRGAVPRAAQRQVQQRSRHRGERRRERRRRLEPGTYDLCDLKTGRNASIIALGAVTLNVSGNFNVGTASLLVPDAGAPLVKVNVLGKRVRIAHDAEVAAVIVAPNARLQFGESTFLGCFCVDTASTDKHITLECPEL